MEFQNISSVMECKYIIDGMADGKGVVLFYLHQDSDVNIKPKLKGRSVEEIRRIEQDALSAMRIYGTNVSKRSSCNDWVMMMNAEEQGMPTRLVEWTDSIDHALLKLIQTADCNCITVISLSDNQMVRFTDSPTEVKRIEFFKATHCDLKQRDTYKWYSIHPLRAGRLQPFDIYSEERIALKSMRVSNRAKQSIKKELIAMGITTTTPIKTMDEPLKEAEQWVANPSRSDRNSLKSQSEQASNAPVLEQYGRKYHEDFDFD